MRPGPDWTGLVGTVQMYTLNLSNGIAGGEGVRPPSGMPGLEAGTGSTAWQLRRLQMEELSDKSAQHLRRARFPSEGPAGLGQARPSGGEN
ncbi:hypothetical protein AAFF_G00422780 [Aldrovandia affinis]|uniref:Uncharacterized protein n=1 Tax=Aldrovandia affinis TaxID=143900 RepID=A0AAD7T6Y8_9TELE|nr:hypothetical protein AAFF_G00422780 [Aldrovandia affinis]